MKHYFSTVVCRSSPPNLVIKSLIYQVTTKQTNKKNGVVPHFSYIDLYESNSNYAFANLKTNNKRNPTFLFSLLSNNTFRL